MGEPLKIRVARAIGSAGTWSSPRNIARAERVLSIPVLAAAPELLAACRALLHHAEGAPAGVLSYTRAAIAKAIGDTNA